ncbi:unnamed protein product [Aureobasidium uvarum]|uniref:BTB domain-containing protein n=1 Tax=Aureobasidium uvarum TaxID=2773716 RepID=A0A9N8PY14_9PEZI|nr:unnamed protein product [Aureobasidium uvarum]
MHITARQNPKDLCTERNRRALMYNNPTTSDTTIHFNGHSIRAHKAILSEHSEVFFLAFQGPFAKVSSYTIATEEYDDQAVEALLKHMYSLPYQEPVDLEVDLQWYLQLYLIAVEYSVESFEHSVVEVIKTEVFASKEVTDDEEVFDDCWDRIKDLYASNSLPMSLFDMVSRLCNQRSRYKGIREESKREKEWRRRQTTTGTKDQTANLRAENLLTSKENWMSVGLEEEVTQMSKKERRKASYEKKTRYRKHRHAHHGRMGSLAEQEEED